MSKPNEGTPESLAATLPSMTIAIVRARLAAGQSPAFIRADAAQQATGLPPLPPPMSLEAFIPWAFKEHDATLRALAEQERIDRFEALRKLYERNPITREAFERSIAEQEREDAPALVARLYEAHIRARVELEKLLRAGSKNEAEALAIHEARLLSDRTHRAHEQAEHDLLGAARYGEAWPEKRAGCMRNGAGPHRPVLSIPPSYGSADVAPTNATFAPDFNDPDAIRIRREDGPAASCHNCEQLAQAHDQKAKDATTPQDREMWARNAAARRGGRISCEECEDQPRPELDAAISRMKFFLAEVPLATPEPTKPKVTP